MREHVTMTSSVSQNTRTENKNVPIGIPPLPTPSSLVEDPLGGPPDGGGKKWVNKFKIKHVCFFFCKSHVWFGKHVSDGEKGACCLGVSFILPFDQGHQTDSEKW